MAGWWEFNNLIDLPDSPTCCTRRAGASGEHWAELVLLPGGEIWEPMGTARTREEVAVGRRASLEECNLMQLKRE